MKDQCTTHLCIQYDILLWILFLCNEVHKIKPLCNPEKWTLGRIRIFNNALSRFLGTRKSNKNWILTVTIQYHFDVKLAFFTVFVLTLQTGFVAHRCFWFSASDSSIEQVCPHLVYTIMCEEARTVITGARSPGLPWNIFTSPGKMC